MLALLGTILCFGQTASVDSAQAVSPDSGKVCLTYPEFDFYAAEHVSAQGLRTDTSILNRVVLNQRNQIRNGNKEVQLAYEVIDSNKNVITAYKVAFNKLADMFAQAGRKINRLKKVNLVLGISTAVLAGVVAIQTAAP